jgi:hypothetical protein
MTYEDEAEAELTASKAPNASVLSANETVIEAAVNGWGVERIEASPDGLGYRLIDAPLPSIFAGLTTGGEWPLSGGFLVQLYRDPFLDSDGIPSPSGAPVSASRLVFLAGNGRAATPNPFPRDIDPGFEPFAFLPAGGAWFASLRKDEAESVDMKFFALDDPLAAPQAGPPAETLPVREIKRSDFEAALKPLPLSALEGDVGASMRSSLALLGMGRYLIRLRSSAGDDRWYLSSGRAEEATNVFAWAIAGKADAAGKAGARVLVLSTEGRLAMSDGRGGNSLTKLAAPAEGAIFTAVAAAGAIAAAAWESGEFPYISSAGIVVAPLGRSNEALSR